MQCDVIATICTLTEKAHRFLFGFKFVHDSFVRSAQLPQRILCTVLVVHRLS